MEMEKIGVVKEAQLVSPMLVLWVSGDGDSRRSGLGMILHGIEQVEETGS